MLCELVELDKPNVAKVTMTKVVQEVTRTSTKGRNASTYEYECHKGHGTVKQNKNNAVIKTAFKENLFHHAICTGVKHTESKFLYVTVPIYCLNGDKN